MTSRWGWQLALSLGILLCALGVVTGGAVAAENGSVAPSADLESETVSFDAERGAQTVDGETNIVLSQKLSRLPDQPGHYLARHSYEFPAAAVGLRVRLPAGATVRAENGFIREADGTYRWDGSTPSPTIAYAVQANESIDQTGPIAGPGRLVYADVGAWGIVSRPATQHGWSWKAPETVGFERETTVSGPGAVGDVIAYLGEYEEYTHRAPGQKFRLIVPESADLAERPSALFEALSTASDQLRIGDRDREVFMIAAPSQNIDWGLRGLQTGPADVWVRDVERLADPDSVWLHEYVHTRQDYAAASDLQWLTEGGATYYAALLAFESGEISFEQFQNRLAVGTSSRYGGTVLSEPTSWQGNAPYHVGALVAGELDRRIRRSTVRSKSFQEVFRQLNALTSVATASDFRSAIAAAGGSGVRSRSDQYTTTTDRPPMWDRTDHREAFEDPPEPARITFSNGVDAVTVDGSYRTRTLRDTERTVVPGETVGFTVVAENFGEQSGEFTARLQTDGTVIDRTSGTLAPGQQQRLNFTYTFSEAGVLRLTVGDASLDFRVVEPAPLRVDSLAVNKSTVAVGDSVELSATVSNDADWPGDGAAGFTRDGKLIDSQRVQLDGLADRQVQTNVTLTEAGTVRFGLGNSTENLTVTAAAPVENDSESSDSETKSDGDGSETESDDDGTSTDDDGTSSESEPNADNAETDTQSESTPTTSDESGSGNAFGPGPSLAIAFVAVAFLVLFSRRNNT